MAKKPKKQKSTAAQQPEAAPVAEVLAEAAEAPAEAPLAAPEPRASSAVSLQDYARQNVIGYKDHWWPSIAKFAESHGIKGSASADKCRSVLSSWGAALK